MRPTNESRARSDSAGTERALVSRGCPAQDGDDDSTSVRSPHLLRELDDQPQLGLLRLRRDRIALGDAGEAALRADRQPREVDVAARRVEPSLERVLVL